MQHIAILGAGTMGHGIAQVCAMAGYPVRLTDVSSQQLEAAVGHIGANLDKGIARGKVDAEVAQLARSMVTTTTRLEEAAEGAQIVIEAVPERLELKRSLLGRAEAVVADDTLLASNTSSLSIDRIAEALRHAERFVGMHFFNPVHIMSLLEVVRGQATPDAIVDRVKAFGQAIGKEVIVVRDAPGFATSRLGVCLGMEAIRMVEQGVASPDDIDTAMVLGYRHPIGPLKLTDLVGLDVRMAIGSYLAGELGNSAFEPPELMKRMVAEGKLGKKSGQGFYSW